MQAEIAFIGFGEAAQAIAEGWAQGWAQSWGRTLRAAAFDPKTAETARACARTGVICAPDRAAALAGARHVLCLVTADQAVTAARECAPHLAPGAVWYDGNSCAPDSKRAAAEIITAAGGVYVDMAIMAPIHPRLHRTPLLIAGPAGALDFLDRMGMDYRHHGTQIGAASAVKMIRSVMVKGIEALTAECLLAATRAGVLEEVLASLDASDPAGDWRARGGYNLERMMQHGQRRAAEMHEAALTVAALGLPAAMARATAGWQDRIGQLGLRDQAGEVGARLELIERALCLSET